jgi:pyrroloquinoline quinone (PQQ) biosynthesis protein C
VVFAQQQQQQQQQRAMDSNVFAAAWSQPNLSRLLFRAWCS